MSDEVLVKCENISKKYCRSLKRSLWYGVKDISSELNPFRGKKDIVGTNHFPELRKDEFWAIQDVSFELKRGECLGLIGQNGAGKSTLLKMLNGLMKPDHGRITMKGRIGALIELNVGFNPILTGRENIYIYGSILGFTKKEIDQKYDAIVEFAELADFMEMPFRSYSSGMKVRLGFAVAAQMEPDVLLIDEVLAVGDIGFRSKCYNRISELMENCAVIFVSHFMPHIAKLCNNVILLNRGKAVCFDKVMIGIDAYNDLFCDQGATIMGTGEAKISGLKLLNKDNFETEEFNFNEPLQLLLDIVVSTKYDEYEISITFMNQEANLIAQCHSGYNGVQLKNNGETRSLKITIDRLILNTGKYYLNVIVYDKTNTKYLTWHLAVAKIKIKADFHGGAPVQFQAVWETSEIINPLVNN